MVFCAPCACAAIGAFCHTVIQGKIESPWNTIELSGRSSRSRTSISIVPTRVAVSSRRRRMRSKRRLAAPGRTDDHEELRRARLSSDTWSTATRLPNDLTMVANTDGRLAPEAVALATGGDSRLLSHTRSGFDRDRYCRESSAPTTMVVRAMGARPHDGAGTNYERYEVSVSGTSAHRPVAK